MNENFPNCYSQTTMRLLRTYIVGEHVIIRANGYQGNFQNVRV